MPLTLLEVENLRLFEKFRLIPDLRLNLVIGRNASGKTLKRELRREAEEAAKAPSGKAAE